MRNEALIHFSIAIVFLLSVIGVYVFGFFMLEAARVEAVELSQEIETIEKTDAATNSAEGTLTSFADDEEYVNRYFLSEEDIVPFLEGLEVTGESLGAAVEVASVTPDAKENADRLTLALRITGPFESVLKTLGAIEYGPRDIRVMNITIDTSLNGDGPRVWTAAATFSVALASSSTPATTP